MIRLKHLLFRYLTPLIVLNGTVLFVGVTYFGAGAEWPILLSAVSIGLSLIFFVQKQKLDELRMFTELFRQFNERYEELNDSLNEIADGGGELDRAEQSILLDYFNLCGEEYLYYRQGYIFPNVWAAWEKGMQYYYAVPRIRAFWEPELRTGSYYGMSLRQLDVAMALAHRGKTRAPAASEPASSP